MGLTPRHAVLLLLRYRFAKVSVLMILQLSILNVSRA
jgi:hypothetical protein